MSVFSPVQGWSSFFSSCGHTVLSYLLPFLVFSHQCTLYITRPPLTWSIHLHLFMLPTMIVSFIFVCFVLQLWGQYYTQYFFCFSKVYILTLFWSVFPKQSHNWTAEMIPRQWKWNFHFKSNPYELALNYDLILITILEIVFSYFQEVKIETHFPHICMIGIWPRWKLNIDLTSC